ncbi:MAG: hypothetical protein P8X57_06080, partial [Cyclobacteriaceae bacterium]
MSPPKAEEMFASARQTMPSIDVEIFGGLTVLFDVDEIVTALESLKRQIFDIVLQLQATYIDKAITVEIARQMEESLRLWSFSEAHTAGRLRLNSFCSINLASHVRLRFSRADDYVNYEPSDPPVRKRSIYKLCQSCRHQMQPGKLLDWLLGQHL